VRQNKSGQKKSREAKEKCTLPLLSLRTTAKTQTIATHCNTLQHTQLEQTATHTIGTHCNTLQHTQLEHTATHCKQLEHTATNCNTPHTIGTHCNTLLSLRTIASTQTYCNTLHHTATHCSLYARQQARKQLQHTATHCNTLQHTALNAHDSEHANKQQSVCVRERRREPCIRGIRMTEREGEQE